MKVFPLAAVAALALLGLLAAPLRADTITLLDGEIIDGVKITAETYAKVEFRRPKVSTPQSVEASEVKSIEYGTTSADYQAGVAARADGKLIEAANAFVAVAEEQENPPFLRALALADAAEALLANGNIDEAGDTFSRLLKEFPDTRHLARALLGKGRALLLSGQRPEAAKAFAALKAEAGSKKLGERWSLLAEFWSLLTVEAEGTPVKAQEALAGYEALRARVAGSHDDIAFKCAVRIGRVKLGGLQHDEARQAFEQVIEARDVVEREDAAAAFNGRGQCLLAEAGEAREAERQAAPGGAGAAPGEPPAEGEESESDALYRAARLDFLRVVVSYADVPSQQAEALYGAAQCFLHLTDPDGTGPGRAAALLRRCRELYPDSPWGKKAAQS